jgi:hypothetical protein
MNGKLEETSADALEELVGKANPLCEELWEVGGRGTGDFRPCGTPSSFHVRLTCTDCAVSRMKFLCSPCLSAMNSPDVEQVCLRCFAEGVRFLVEVL